MFNPKANNSTVATRGFLWGFWIAVCTLAFTLDAYAGVPPVIGTQPASKTVASGSNVTFTVTATSATTLSYQWYFNGSKITGATSNTLSINAQYTNAGPYYASVANAYGTMNSAVATLNVTAPVGSTLSAPWISADIGAVGLVGSSYNKTNLYTVTGAGASLAGAVADQFQFVYQTMVADGSIIARIASQNGTNANGYAGVMVRETTATGSSFMFVAREGDGKTVVRSRTSTGGATTSTNGVTLTIPNYWVELIRTGNKIAALTSTNGSNWVGVQTNTFTMATNVVFGLFVTSGNTNALSTGSFTNITAVP